MDFTREPIIQTIITPKEGCKLVIRSSKNAGQEEYFVDAVEVVSFGHASFFRSLERPKPFLVPISDYEIVEVREARMVLKNVGIDRSIKIGGGRESISRSGKSVDKEAAINADAAKIETPIVVSENGVEAKPEARPGAEKKRDRRRQYRKRRGGQLVEKEEDVTPVEPISDAGDEEKASYQPAEEQVDSAHSNGSLFSSLLQPPPTLISETINRYRENALFKSAFFLTEEEQYKPHDKVQELLNEDEEVCVPALQEPVFVDNEGLPERSFAALKEPHEEEVIAQTQSEHVNVEEALPESSETFQLLEEYYQPVEEFTYPVAESYAPAEESLSVEDKPIEEFVEEIQPLEDFKSTEEFILPSEEMNDHKVEKPAEEEMTMSLFQEEDDEKFIERKRGELDQEKN